VSQTGAAPSFAGVAGDGVFVAFAGFDDAEDERVADDIRAAEMMDVDAGNVAEDAADPSATGIKDVGEARVLVWEKTLRELKGKLAADELNGSAKSADWKVAVATEMKRRTTATNQWLADALGMGSMFTVSRLAKECRSGMRAGRHFKKLTAKSKA
jgi:hypothetical protein